MRETNQLRKWSKEHRSNGRSRVPLCDNCGKRHSYETPCKPLAKVKEGK